MPYLKNQLNKDQVKISKVVYVIARLECTLELTLKIRGLLSAFEDT